jgi:adenylate cyclase, class 2
MRRARTHREIEVKIPVADLPGTLAKLRKLGAVSEGRVFERNTLYDTPGGDLRRSGRLLRLRTEAPAPARGLRGGSSKAVITSKVPALVRGSRYKEKLEREVQVRSAAKWPARLRALGFRPGFRYEKYRAAFRLASLHLDLDETPIGEFLELEGRPGEIDRAARALGFSPRDYIRGTYWDLFQAWRRGRARFRKNMTFRP